MRRNDIRFNGKAATLRHHSARGKVTRNAGNFTRGSQLVTHEFLMTFAGIKIPFTIWSSLFTLILCITLAVTMHEHEVQLVLMRLWSTFWTMMGFDEMHMVNLTLPSGQGIHVPMGYVPHHPIVAAAWSKALRCVFGSAFIALFVAAPVIMWFVDFSRKRGKAILDERHERGAMMVERDVLLHEILAHNADQFTQECAAADRPRDPKSVAKLSPPDRADLGIHTPYMIAGIPYPWRLEQSHTMLIGTTGSGKTTQLRSLVTQLRARGHRAVIFDLTGAFVEAFYDKKTDVILNPMDERCPAWTLFSECENYADFLSAAAALIPSHPDDKEPFWQNAARTLFIEMCIKLRDSGETTNAAIAHHLMTADLKSIHAKLSDTVAAPLTTEKAARMAESIRSVFNTNGQALRFLPDPTDDGPPPFCIRDWIASGGERGSILFITASYTDLELTRALMTMWMDIAVNSLMRLPKTRNLRTWFLFDEVHALHALPAIGHGLQSARNFGGAFVLGIHSFDKLVETYGQQGATALAGLARTKLILSTADRTTAEKCSEFIGSREVRQMDEAYSYGYNNTRDASTLTPRKMVEPLVIPDDITNLPSMHGFVKFPDGFPAARIKLKWTNYPETAHGFRPRKDFKPTEYFPPSPKRKSADEEGTGGTEHVPNSGIESADIKVKGELDNPSRPSLFEISAVEHAAQSIEVRSDGVPKQAVPITAPDAQPAADKPGAARDANSMPQTSAAARSIATSTAGMRIIDTPRARAVDGAQPGRDANQRADDAVRATRSEGGPEEQILRETREGAGVEPLHHHHSHHAARDAGTDIDDGYGIGG